MSALPEYLEQAHWEILTPNYYYCYVFLSSLYLPVSSGVRHSLYDNEGQAEEELHFPENNYSYCVSLIAFSLSLCLPFSPQ